MAKLFSPVVSGSKTVTPCALAFQIRVFAAAHPWPVPESPRLNAPISPSVVMASNK